MKVVYTMHAKEKFKFLRELGFRVLRKDVLAALNHPDIHGISVGRDAEFVVKEIDDKYNLRVIYAKKDGIIVIITFHPTRKGRYTE